MKIKKTDKYASQIIKTVKDQQKVRNIISDDLLIPTGSTLMNLALSGNKTGGYSIGKFSNLIGDSHAGKSILALNMLAECCYRKRFKDYDLIYDDVEVANEFDIGYLFGEKAAKRIDLSIISDTAEDFYGNIYRKIQKGKPFIYVLDTFDAIASEEDRDRANQFAKKGKISGTYGTSKPKLASEMFRTIKSDIKKVEAFLLILSQTRDNIGFGAMFRPKTRAGGKALKFYSSHEIWLAVKRAEKINGVIVGSYTEFKITKNKLTGKKRSVDIPIFDDYGIDDISANIDFLVENKFWEKKKNTIIAEQFNLEGSKKKIVSVIEKKNMEPALIDLTADCWNKIEESLKLNRKPRYE